MGFDVVLCGDLWTPESAEEEMETIIKSVLGRRMQYVRVQAELLGGNQFSSLTSAWDSTRHQLRIRRQVDAFDDR